MTPRKIGLLLERQRLRLRREETLVAVLRLDIINFSVRRPKEPFKLSDILPDEDLQPAQKALRKKFNRRKIAEDTRFIFGSLMRIQGASVAPMGEA